MNQQFIFSTRRFVDVGIMEAQEVEVSFHGNYSDSRSGVPGKETCRYRAADISGETVFCPDSDDAFFEIKDVTIGKEFHWQQKEDQRFRGILILRADGDRIIVVNRLPIERYLESVISSEMSANASIELLKAHAVISRSWLVAQIASKENNASKDCSEGCAMVDNDDERIVWYDHSQHTGFDVCADDHCQRYQGITRILNSNAVKAVAETEGEILMYGNDICDARFSKCCGGAFETFENCWQPQSLPYLAPGRDIADRNSPMPDLSDEKEARRWILSAPEAFCNTSDKEILSQVLNDYDRATSDFYRWKVSYIRSELSDIVRERLGIDLGEICSLTPLERGKSGRITRLLIKGTKKSMTIGKELEIRRVLSRTHLYSSAFVVATESRDRSGLPRGFTLTGAGWGHGAGLCQIGAAMMAQQGYAYHEILRHYYPGAKIRKIEICRSPSRAPALGKNHDVG